MKLIKIQIDTVLAMMDFYFFFLLTVMTNELLELIKRRTRSVISCVVDSSGSGNNGRQPRVGGERHTVLGENE